MLVPERGDPTTKTGLFTLRCIQPLWVISLFLSSQASAFLPVGPSFSKDTLALCQLAFRGRFKADRMSVNSYFLSLPSRGAGASRNYRRPTKVNSGKSP